MVKTLEGTRQFQFSFRKHTIVYGNGRQWVVGICNSTTIFSFWNLWEVNSRVVEFLLYKSPYTFFFPYFLRISGALSPPLSTKEKKGGQIRSENHLIKNNIIWNNVKKKWFGKTCEESSIIIFLSILNWQSRIVTAEKDLPDVSRGFKNSTVLASSQIKVIKVFT